METRKKVSDLRGVLVVAYEEGVQLGKVHDIYVEKPANAVKGISFKAGLLGLEKESFVGIENIRKMGKDVVIVSSETAVTPVPEALAGSSLKALRGFKITTHEGEHLGELSDLNVIMESGKISGIILTEKKMLDIDIEDITIGPDVIMVPADYVTHIKAIEEEKAGGLARRFRTPAVSESVKETVKETVEKVGETVERVLKKSRPGPKNEEERPRRKASDAENVEKPAETPGQDAAPEDKRSGE